MICDKVTFESYKGAKKHAATLAASQNSKLKMVPYKCPNCGAFHLSTRNSTKKLWNKKDMKYKPQVGEYVSNFNHIKKVVSSIKKKGKKSKKFSSADGKLASEKVFKSLFNI